MDNNIHMHVGDDFVRVKLRMQKAGQKVEDEVEKELKAIGLDIRGNIMRKMKHTQKSNKSYGPKGHRPSLPGNPPAIDSGRLVNSFEVNKIKNGIEVGTNVEYAKYLQNGTQPHVIRTKSASVLTNGSDFFGKRVQHPGIKPRPFLEPGMEDIDFTGRIKDAIKRGMR